MNNKILNLDIERFIDNKEERLYLDVKFEVLENVEKIEVSYQYEKVKQTILEDKSIVEEEINVVDIGIKDEIGNIRGWSGSKRKNFYIHENYATPGYIKGKVIPGKWKIILGAYKIQEGGCKVSISVKLHLKEMVMLKGDLHMHTNNSDGDHDVKDVISLCKLNGLDFAFLTDHNIYSQNMSIVSDEDLIVMPGMELTHYDGHCNFLGIENPVSNPIVNSKEELKYVLREARNNGAIISLNHPFCKYCGWKFGFDVDFDIVEVWNGPMKEADMDAILWWDKQLKLGKKVPIVGGSDSHKNELLRPIGSPTTCVYSQSKGISDIKDAILKGNSFLTYTTSGPTIEMNINNAIMGEEVKYNKGITGKVNIGNLNTNDEIRIVSDDGCQELVQIKNEKIKMIEFEVKDRLYYRVEVSRRLTEELEPSIVALSNPIYIVKG